MKRFSLFVFCLLLFQFSFAQTIFGTQQIIAINADGTSSVFAIDLDNDGDNDILSASEGDDKIAWYKNDGTGNFGDQIIITTNANGAKSVFAIDLDNDGDNDVLSASYTDGLIAWYENDGTGQFGSQQIIWDYTEGPRSIYAIDLDNDNDNDVLMAARTSNGEGAVTWYENDGNGNFNVDDIYFSSIGYTSVFAIDLDNDGDNDVLTTSYCIEWSENLGNGSFASPQIVGNLLGVLETDVYSKDLDNDGDNDVLMASNSKIAWSENLGNGNFGNWQIISSGDYGSSSIFSKDLDNDGDNDVLSAMYGDDLIVWFENDGVGNFGDQQVITINTNGASDVFSIDLNNDNDNDIISASFVDDKIAWYENYINSISYSEKEFCEGDSILINEEWISTPGTYYDTIPTALGGDSIMVYEVYSLPNPDYFQITGPSLVEEYTVATYSVPVNPDVEYSFEAENGNIIITLENSVEVQWTENSMGFVKAIATFPDSGCDMESVLHVTIGTGDIGEYNQIHFRLYPNPANDMLLIESNISSYIVEIINITGKVVKYSDQSKIVISELESSIYFVKIFDKQGNLIGIEKLIIVR